MENKNYESLKEVLDDAFAQAAHGKGVVRHGQGDFAFEDQPMQSISKLLGTPDGLLFQAIKKTRESQHLSFDEAVPELLGAINYLAGAVVFLRSQQFQRGMVEQFSAPLSDEKMAEMTR